MHHVPVKCGCILLGKLTDLAHKAKAAASGGLDLR